MSTLYQVIAQVDDIKPNAFSDDTKTSWINEVEGLVQTEVMLLAQSDVVVYDYDDNPQVELMAKPPHDKIYWTYLAAMVDFANGEYNKYQNTVQMFNSHYSEYMRWYAGRYRPADGDPEEKEYYLSAYALAVKHGYQGTEEEWLDSLHGDPGPAVELRYNEDSGVVEWKAVDSSAWTALLTMEELQGDVVAQTTAAAQEARDGAETAQEGAEAAEQSAGSAAGVATAAAQRAEAAEQEAEASAGVATIAAQRAEAAEQEAVDILNEIRQAAFSANHEGGWELLEDFTLEENINNLIRTKTPDGRDYNLSRFGVIVSAQPGPGNTGLNVIADKNGVRLQAGYIDQAVNTTKIQYGYSYIYLENGAWFARGATAVGGYSWTPTNETGFSPKQAFKLSVYDSIDKITLHPNVENGIIPAGTRIELYGVWADEGSGNHGSSGDLALSLGHGLEYDGDGRLSVVISNEPEQDNTLPITSAAVATAIGNIEILLDTI